MCLAPTLRDNRVSSDFVQVKTEGVHFFFPKEVAFTLFIGLKLLVATGSKVSVFNAEDVWSPLSDGGAHWWLPFHPFMVLSKNSAGTFFAYAACREHALADYVLR